MNIFQSLYDFMTSYVWAAYFITLGASFVLGLALSLTYLKIKKGSVYVKFTPVTIMLIAPAMTAIVGLLNVRNAELEASDAIRVGLVLTAGIALTRFRSDKLRIEDMLYLVVASVIGIVLGIGYVAYGTITAVLFLLVMTTTPCRQIRRGWRWFAFHPHQSARRAEPKWRF